MKVSVITIVYNNQDSIASCIESVLSQTYNNIEHIVIDGASTDNTVAVIEKYKSQLAYFVSEKDKGLYNALNKGIKKATGDIIGILHSDDLYYENNTIEKVVNQFKSTNADLVYGEGIYVDKIETSIIKRIYPSKPFKKCYLKYGWIPLHTGIYVKKEVFEKYGFYDEGYSIASDYEISLRWFSNSNIKKVFLNEYLVRMRMGGKSTTAKLQKKKSTEDFDIIKKYGLLGPITLGCKIARKIPQYLRPKLNI